MKPPRKVSPWTMACLVAMAVIGGSITWDLAGPADQPEPNDREAVSERLSQVRGVRPVLPVTLPPGYNFARDYDHYALDEPRVFDGTIERADYWEISFFPEDGASKDGLPVVVFCVQRSNLKDSVCPEQNDRPHLQREFGHSRIAIHRASVGRRDMTAWSAIELTTDLDKVIWLQ